MVRTYFYELLVDLDKLPAGTKLRYQYKQWSFKAFKYMGGYTYGEWVTIDCSPLLDSVRFNRLITKPCGSVE